MAAILRAMILGLALVLFGAVAALAMVKKIEPPQRLPLIQADMPYCVTIKNPPLELTKPDTEPFPRRPDDA